MLMMLKKSYSGIIGKVFHTGDIRIVKVSKSCSAFLNNLIIKEKHCEDFDIPDDVFSRLHKTMNSNNINYRK